MSCIHLIDDGAKAPCIEVPEPEAEPEPEVEPASEPEDMDEELEIPDFDELDIEIDDMDEEVQDGDEDPLLVSTMYELFSDVNGQNICEAVLALRDLVEKQSKVLFSIVKLLEKKLA